MTADIASPASRPKGSLLSRLAGILLLLVIPTATAWVFGNAVIAQKLADQKAAAVGLPDALPAPGDVAGRLDSHQAKAALNAFVLFLGLLLVLVVKETDFGNRFRIVSVRYKLIGLLLYAVILPISGLLFFGWKYVAEFRELLVQEAYIACQASINDVENGFEKEKSRLLQRFRSYRNMPELQADPGSLYKKFRDLERNKQMTWIEVRDMNANVLLTTQSDKSNKLSIICKAIARLGITRFLGHRLAMMAPQRLNASEVLIQEFFESPLGGWGRVFESPNELHRASFAGQDILYYWDVFQETDIKPAYLVVDLHMKYAVRSYLLESLDKRISSGHGALRMLAWSIPFKTFLQEKPPEDATIKQFVDRVILANAPLNAAIRWQNDEWLAVGTPGKKLPESVLQSLYPVGEIDRQIAAIRSDLFWGVILAVIIAVLIGMLFSHTLIRPVANLMGGVQALRRRDTSHRLEILQNDELGKLSARFNATSETLADVIYAKDIQALMIPEKAPEIKGYAADLINIPAADLGGDFCDILPVGPDKWLMVIGDVTGHGVSSALVTAMTKTIVSEYARKEQLELSDMLACLNDMLYSQFQRKKCMTFFAAMLDTRDGTIECAAAAHPLPLLFRGGRLEAFPKIGCPPLGFSQDRKEFPRTTIMLEPGDCLVLFTDILIELHDRTGKPLGTKGFAAICERHVALEPAAMRARILEDVTAIGGSELDDDLTMIVLKRGTAVATAS
ncbi:MAG TPA: SpoIIE family protein phosphatase [Candidatus Ozemobacteraceae bacterium]|nr:SpoIIE family protein phosphatase [Candidatus Ozemobacteraceae bacterium]